MLQYTIKRLLLMPPTFFLVSLVIFIVLNVAPGRPGASASAAESGESSDSANQRESFRIFKEQFNLDKPILFNTRFNLTRDDIEEILSIAHNVGDRQDEPSVRVEAQENLDDYGNYMVRHLLGLVFEHPSADMQRLAAGYLVRAAKIRFVRDDHGRDEQARSLNRLIGQKNEEFADWFWKSDATIEEIEATKALWKTWWEQRRDDYEYTFGEKVSAFFFDTRFAKYWGNLIALDFGISTADRREILPTILSKLKYSLSLTLVSVLLAYLIAIPIGIYSAVRPGSKSDGAITLFLFVMYSLPTFFTGTVYLRLLSEGSPVAWFPTGGFQSADGVLRTTLEQGADITWHLVLPILTFTAVSLAALSRYARSGVIDVIRADYIRTARAKGLHEFVVIVKHAVRNGMIPILTLLGTLLPVLVSGSVVVEVIFGIPGMGLYLFDAINLRDYNAVMGVLVIASLLTLVGILVSDLSYAAVDPRISFD